MIQAMHRLNIEEALMQKLAVQLYGVADFMRNRE
jgi:hemoglobin